MPSREHSIHFGRPEPSARPTGMVVTGNGAAGATAAEGVAAAIALIYLRHGMANRAAGDKAAAAGGSWTPDTCPVPTVLPTGMEAAPTVAWVAAVDYWLGFGCTLGCDTEIPASTSLHSATTSPHSTLPPPPTLLFIRMFSTNAFTLSSNLWMKAWYTL